MVRRGAREFWAIRVRSSSQAGLACVLAGSMLAFATAASAQTQVQGLSTSSETIDHGAPPNGSQPPATSEGLGDIIVTAQFRAQNVQKTPLAITAVDAALIEQRGYSDISDLTSAAPNVTFSPGVGVYSGATLYIRGVGQFDSNPAFEPGVGVYIDDVYYGSVAGANMSLLDLDRVEILRGPQGTLAGANSIGGAVKLFTQKPRNDTSGYFEAGYGSRDAYVLRGAFNIPLTDTLYFRLSGALKREGGYVKRLDFPCVNKAAAGSLPSLVTKAGSCVLDTAGEQTTQVLRGALRWEPNDQLEVNISGDVDLTETNANPQILYAVNEAAVEGPYQAGQLARYGVKLDSRFLPPPGSYISYQTYNDPDRSRPYDPDGKTKNYGFSATIDYKINGALSVKSITAFRKSDITAVEDVDGTPLNANTGTNNPHIKQFTQELRLNGSVGSLIDWTVGGFYFDSKQRLDGEVGVRSSLSFIPGGLDFFINDRLGKRKVAGYVTLVLHPAAGLNITGGYRYTHSKLDYTFGRIDPNPPSIVTILHLDALGEAPSASNSKSDFRLAADYQILPNLMTYAQFATGFKDGGINPTPTSPAQQTPFAPETLSSYEIGLKSELFHRHVRLNLAGFVSKYKDLQLRAFTFDNNGVQATLTSNAGAATMKGVEGELEITPLSGLNLSASASYLDFDYDDLGQAASVPNPPCASCRNVYTPKYTAYLAAQYAIDLASRGTITPRISANYRGKVYGDLNNNSMTALDGWWVADARLGWKSADRNWEAALQVNNLFNKYYFLQVHSVINQGGTAVAVPGRPRQFLFTIRRSF